MSLFIKIHCSLGVDQLWHTDQIGPVPALCGLWTKNGFDIFKSLKKEEKNVLWHIKITWNSNFSVQK